MEDRYSRQTRFAPIGESGQARLRSGRALLVGCGALGSVLAEILTRAGVGHLTLVDRDYIEPSNLQRQSLYTEQDCREGLPKAVAAARRLRDINGEVAIEEHARDLNPHNIADLVRDQDVILDGTDNFETRYLLNDASVKWKIPWVHGACVGSYGVCFAFVPGRCPCLRCVLSQIPAPGSSPTCDTTGVIGPIVHTIAGLQAAEAIKLLTGASESLNPRLVTVDVWKNQIQTLDLSRFEQDPECPACALHRYDFLEGEFQARAQTLCGRNAVQVSRSTPRPVDFAPIAERLARLGPVSYNEYLLRARMDPFEIALFRDGRGIVRGTEDVEEARRVYARLVGN